MDKKKQVGVASSSSSSSSSSLDHLFGPNKGSSSSSSSSSSTTGWFGSIFPPPSMVIGTQSDFATQIGARKYQTPDEINGCKRGGRSSKEKNQSYHNEEAEPCYLSSSIYYGGQENYSPRTKTNDSHHAFKKDGNDENRNGSYSRDASRGNWWEGSLYY